MVKTLLRYHKYRLRKSAEKEGRYISSIMPIEDREVTDVMFDKYEDVTNERSQ